MTNHLILVKWPEYRAAEIARVVWMVISSAMLFFVRECSVVNSIWRNKYVANIFLPISLGASFYFGSAPKSSRGCSHIDVLNWVMNFHPVRINGAARKNEKNQMAHLANIPQ